MYKKLLISAGGGIISRDQQAEQNEAATIAIGLGGTGISCLRALKKEVYDRIKPDVDNPLIPNYKHIKFLAIDTDKSSLGDTGTIDTLDSNTEFLDLSCNDIGALLAGAAVLKNKKDLQWLKAKATQPNGDGISIKSAEAGAGGVRQIGRLLLYQNCTAFITKLTNMITEARKDLTESEINIHIFTGIGGGTGAGTFLDVCYLVQHVLATLGIQGMTQTCGYFFLPDVNIDKIKSADVQEYIKSNGFAAMKELDYCMNFDINGGEWNQTYDGGITIKTTEPPVKLAHLITATDSNGMISKNAYDYAMHVAVDYVMDFLIKPKVSETDKTDNPFTVKSHISNIESLTAMAPKQHGAGYQYCILGASNAYLPYKEITTYLTSKIFEGFSKIDHQLPGDNDIDLFVQTTGLKYEDLCKELRSKVPPVPLFEVDTKTIYEQTSGISPDVIPQVLGQMRDSLARIGGQVAENKKNMLQSLEIVDIDAAAGISSLITRVRKKIIEISQQPDKGPYYGGAILHSVKARDLQNRIDGYIEQNNRNLSMVRSDMQLRDQSIENTLRNLQNSNAFNRGGRGKEYVQAVHSYYRQQADIEFYNTLGDVLSAFKKQVEELYTQQFSIFENVMKSLEQTFEENRSTLATPVAEPNDYAIKLMSIQDLKDSLDEAVKAMKIDDLISGFVNYMLNNIDIWIAQDESKIAHSVSQFFLRELREFTGKTIVDYLKIKFDTEDKATLAGKIYSEIVLPLSAKAAPLLWIDGSKYQLPSNSKFGFCTIPEISDEIKTAAATYHDANPMVQIRPSFCTDRISFMIFNCAIPLYGYKGVDNYRNAKRIVGAHLYEGAVGDDRDWRTLYDITPYSCINDDQCSDKLKEKASLVDEAKELGIFVKRDIGTDGSFEYVLRQFDMNRVNDEIAAVDKAIASGNEATMQACLNSVKESELTVTNEQIIKNIGTAGYEDISAKDLLIASDALLDIVASQKELLGKRKAAVDNLTAKIKGVVGEKLYVKYFAGALCTGVITKENEYTYTYKKVSFGVPEDISLTTIDSMPYGEDMPLYSAYVGFTQLDESVMEEINKAIRDKKVNFADEVAAATASAKELIAEDKINKIVQRAQQSYNGALGEITAFLKSFSFEVNNF